jgi:hypothetical protein
VSANITREAHAASVVGEQRPSKKSLFNASQNNANLSIREVSAMQTATLAVVPLAEDRTTTASVVSMAIGTVRIRQAVHLRVCR